MTTKTPQAPAASIGWQAPRWERRLHDRRVRGKTCLSITEDELGNAAGTAVHAALHGLVEDVADAPDLEDCIDAAHDVTVQLGRGLYSRLYNIDAQPESGGAGWAQAVLKEIQGSRDIDDLATSVGMDPDMAAIATASIVKAMAEVVPEIIEQMAEQGQDPTEDPNGGDGDEDGDQQGGGGQGQGDGQGSGSRLPQLSSQARKALAEAVRQAQGEVSDARAGLAGILPGLGSVPAAHEQVDAERLALAEKLLNDKSLQKVLRLAGRITRIAERVRWQSVDNVPESVVDVETGGDIEKLLPTELMNLADPELELLAFSRLLDRSCLQYKMSGKERLGRGSIVMLLDTSGSMMDHISTYTRLELAAGLGIASVRSAAMQRRRVVVATFDTRIRSSVVVEAGDMKGAKEAILQLATITVGGGTSFDAPLNWALDNGAEEARADLVMVTDGMAYANDGTIARLEASKATGLRCFGIIAGSGGFDGTISELCDDVVTIDRSNENDVASVVGGLGV